MLQEVWVGVSDEMRQILERFTLADLVEPHPRRPPRSCSTPPDQARRGVESSATGGASASPPRGMRTTTSSPPAGASARARRRRRRPRRARARSRARGRSARSGDRCDAARSPDCQNRSNARGALLRRSCPGPASLHLAARPSRSPLTCAATTHRAAGGRDLERVVEQVVEDLLEAARRRCAPARSSTVGGDVHVARSAANASHASHAGRRRTHVDGRPSRATTAPARRARDEQAVDEAATAAHLGERAVEVFGPALVAPRPRGSRAGGRSAASGVRSWCDASATNACCDPTSCLEARRGRVERHASTVSSGGSSGTVDARRQVALAEARRGLRRGRRAAW